MSAIKVVFVCTGNTCRSPMAAAMATQIFASAGINAEVYSAGVNAMNNQPASRHAVKVMEEGGLCLLSHKAAVVSGDMLDTAALVLTMTGSHRAVLLADYPAVKGKIYTLAEYVGNDLNITDPYGGSIDEYRACATQMRKLLELTANKLYEIDFF
ncbi:MAG: low molecular weight protein arginine phosphatase [Defluviitaleaceae bacterium]|nr:low molecular weight protein arginine phosphatase [Defluviitaleaceae bacterium]